MDKENNIIDADFIEVDNENTKETLENKDNINKKPLFYNCKQVAQIVGEPESTIRYWAKFFDGILHIQVSNMVKKYTKTDIENLLFIKKLKDDNMTLKQIYEYCSEKGFNGEEQLIDSSNPLAVKAMVAAVAEEFEAKFNNMLEEIIKNQNETIRMLKEEIDNNNEILNQSISETVDEIVSEKLDKYVQEISKELLVTKETNDKIDKLRESMEKRKNETENKNFFSRILGKRNK